MQPQAKISIDVSAFQSFSPAMSEFFENAKATISKIQQRTNEAVQILREKVQETPLSPLANKAYTISTQVEMAFNITACLPLIGTVFSCLRILAAKAQFIAGAVLMVAGKVGYFVSRFGQADELTLNKWKIIANYGAENVLHGCLNILRGIGETLISAVTLGLGSVSLIVPNLIIKDPFAPLIKYGDFIKPDISDKEMEQETTSEKNTLITTN